MTWTCDISVPLYHILHIVRHGSSPFSAFYWIFKHSSTAFLLSGSFNLSHSTALPWSASSLTLTWRCFDIQDVVFWLWILRVWVPFVGSPSPELLCFQFYWPSSVAQMLLSENLSNSVCQTVMSHKVIHSYICNESPARVSAAHLYSYPDVLRSWWLDW